MTWSLGDDGVGGNVQYLGQVNLLDLTEQQEELFKHLRWDLNQGELVVDGGLRMYATSLDLGHNYSVYNANNSLGVTLSDGRHGIVPVATYEQGVDNYQGFMYPAFGQKRVNEIYPVAENLQNKISTQYTPDSDMVIQKFSFEVTRPMMNAAFPFTLFVTVKGQDGISRQLYQHKYLKGDVEVEGDMMQVPLMGDIVVNKGETLFITSASDGTTNLVTAASSEGHTHTRIFCRHITMTPVQGGTVRPDMYPYHVHGECTVLAGNSNGDAQRIIELSPNYDGAFRVVDFGNTCSAANTIAVDLQDDYVFIMTYAGAAYEFFWDDGTNPESHLEEGWHARSLVDGQICTITQGVTYYTNDDDVPANVDSLKVAVQDVVKKMGVNGSNPHVDNDRLGHYGDTLHLPAIEPFNYVLFKDMADYVSHHVGQTLPFEWDSMHGYFKLNNEVDDSALATNAPLNDKALVHYGLMRWSLEDDYNIKHLGDRRSDGLRNEYVNVSYERDLLDKEIPCWADVVNHVSGELAKLPDVGVGVVTYDSNSGQLKVDGTKYPLSAMNAATDQELVHGRNFKQTAKYQLDVVYNPVTNRISAAEEPHEINDRDYVTWGEVKNKLGGGADSFVEYDEVNKMFRIKAEKAGAGYDLEKGVFGYELVMGNNLQKSVEELFNVSPLGGGETGYKSVPVLTGESNPLAFTTYAMVKTMVENRGEPIIKIDPDSVPRRPYKLDYHPFDSYDQLDKWQDATILCKGDLDFVIEPCKKLSVADTLVMNVLECRQIYESFRDLRVDINPEIVVNLKMLDELIGINKADNLQWDSGDLRFRYVNKPRPEQDPKDILTRGEIEEAILEATKKPDDRQGKSLEWDDVHKRHTAHADATHPAQGTWDNNHIMLYGDMSDYAKTSEIPRVPDVITNMSVEAESEFNRLFSDFSYHPTNRRWSVTRNYPRSGINNAPEDALVDKGDVSQLVDIKFDAKFPDAVKDLTDREWGQLKKLSYLMDYEVQNLGLLSGKLFYSSDYSRFVDLFAENNDSRVAIKDAPNNSLTTKLDVVELINSTGGNGTSEKSEVVKGLEQCVSFKADEKRFYLDKDTIDQRHWNEAGDRTLLTKREVGDLASNLADDSVYENLTYYGLIHHHNPIHGMRIADNLTFKGFRGTAHPLPAGFSIEETTAIQIQIENTDWVVPVITVYPNNKPVFFEGYLKSELFSNTKPGEMTKVVGEIVVEASYNGGDIKELITYESRIGIKDSTGTYTELREADEGNVSIKIPFWRK